MQLFPPPLPVTLKQSLRCLFPQPNQLDGECVVCAAEEPLELANQSLESKQKAPLMPQVLDAEAPEV